MNSLKTVFLLLPVLLSGCGIHELFAPTTDYYYLNPDKNLSSVGRTVLIELDNNSSYPQIATDVTEALFRSLQKKQVFGLTVIRQSDPAWRSLQLDMNRAYTLEQLSAMRKTLNCDAILIGTVTGFEPFPHLTIGLRLELRDLADGQLLWALEQIWDTTDKTTENRIKNHYSRHNFLGSATLQEKLGTVSSLKFIKFVAYETAETLQPGRTGLIGPKER
jgi:hypothetical protein